MSAITAKASRKMKKYAVLTREPRCFLGSFDFSWKQRKFEEIAVRSSVICSDDTLPRVEYEDIVSGTGRLNKDIYAKQSIKSGIAFHQGDVLYGKLRPYLQNWLLPTFDGLAVGDFWVLQPQNADSSFLYRLIQSRQFDEVANQSTGTKMPRADWKLVSKTVFSIPSNISEQAAIGTYFTALDSLITLHQRKCANLCSPSQVVFSLLFATSTFSWEQRKLSECAGFRRGSFPQPYGNKDWYDGEGAMSFVQVADVACDMQLVEDTKQKISKLAQPMSVFAEKGSVLVTLQGSIGRVAITQYGAFVDRTVLIFDKYAENIDKRFWAYIIKEKFEDEARKAPGGTIKTITKEALSDFELKIPSYEEQGKLADYLMNLDHLITLHQRMQKNSKQYIITMKSILNNIKY